MMMRIDKYCYIRQSIDSRTTFLTIPEMIHFWTTGDDGDGDDDWIRKVK